MKRKIIILCLVVFVICGLTASARASRYQLVVDGEQLRLNGAPFLVKGLRCSNALISDATTEQLIDNLSVFASYGVNSVSVFFQGSRFGDVKGYQEDGALSLEHTARMARIIEAADERGMVVLVGCLYWSTSKAKWESWTQKEADAAVANTVAWLKEHDYRNVLVDVDNEGMARKAKGFDNRQMVIAGKKADPACLIGTNYTGDPPPEADLALHHSNVAPGKPYIQSEGSAPKAPGGYWGSYSKREGLYDYINIGVYSDEMKDAQIAEAKQYFARGQGYMFASTWLQCPPPSGPNQYPGGIGTKDDPGIRWWLEWLRGESGAYIPPARALTSGPKFHWFAYYDKLQFDPSGRYLLSNEVGFEGRSPKADDILGVGMIDLQDGNRWTDLGTSRAWGWQQGCMLQWIPGSKSDVMWNDREGERFVCHVMNTLSGKTGTIPWPIYTLSPDGKTGLSVDFRRIQDMRPGYGYAGLPDPNKDVLAPEDSGVWRVDMATGEAKMLLSIAQAARIPYEQDDLSDAKHYFNHLLVNPSGERFIVLHRWRKPGAKTFGTRMLTVGMDGKDVRVVDPYGRTSHFIWRDADHILAWAWHPSHKDAFYLYSDEEKVQVEVVGQGVMSRNGHCTYLPGNQWILNDTYPQGAARQQELYLYQVASGRKVSLGMFSSPPAYAGEWRVDLHPRFSPDGTRVAIDSPHGGNGRQLYMVDVRNVLNAHSDYLIEKKGPGSNGDQITFQEKEGVVVFSIRSEGGIGRASIRPTGGEWAGSVEFALHLRSLEGFSATCGEKKFEYSLPRAERSRRTAEKDTSPIIVNIPRDILENGKPLEIQWIDFYR